MKYIERFWNWLNYSPTEALWLGFCWGLSIGLIMANAKAEAKDCFLSYDQNQTLFVDCRIGAKPSEYTRVCRMVDGERDGSLYNAEIVTRDQNGDIVSSRQWTFTEVVAPEEEILCTISQTRKQAKADARAAAEAAEQARHTAKQQRKDRAKTICQNQPGASPLKALCESVFDEDL